MIHIKYEREQGIVLVRTIGFLTVAQVEEGLADTQASIIEMRRDRGRARILIIASEVVQVEAVVSRMAELRRRRLPGERVAMVVTSMLSKMQLSRAASADDEQVFTSESAARDWLSVGMSSGSATADPPSRAVTDAHEASALPGGHAC